jgi:hypothetical protein
MPTNIRKSARFVTLTTVNVASLLLITCVAAAQTSTSPNLNQTPGSAAAPQTTADAAAGKSAAQLAGLYVYPQKSQDATLQAKDESECFDSAKQNTGFDPAAPAAAAPQSAQGPKGGAVKGGAKGAAGGAAIGAITGDAGTGAEVGAVVGAAAAHRRQKKAKKQAQQQAQQATQSQQGEQLDGFRRAMSACLDARGYSVK